MRIRTASAATIVAALGVTLLAPAAAQAAPEPITARFASSAQAPGGTWAGLEPITSDGTAVVETPITGSTSLDLRVHEPAGASGRVLDPALEGTVALDVTQLQAGAAGTEGALITSSPVAPTAQPTGWPGANDTLTSGFAIEQEIQRWSFSYAFDFSGLAGGVLPAGSRLAVADVDVCQNGPTPGGVDERFSAASDATGPWLDYQYRVIGSGTPATNPPTVTYDAATNAYGIVPQCEDRTMIEVFVTTQPVSTLSLELANRQGAGVTRFGLLLPTAAPAPAVTIVKTTNGEDVATEPGPSLPIGSDVDYGFAVTNTGTTDLADVTVTDDQVEAAAIDCGDGTNVIPFLAVGDSASCTATSTVVVGQHANTATATGSPVDSRGAAIAGASAPSGQDSSWHVGVEVPSATVATTADVDEALPGDDVIVTTVVESTGDADLDAADVAAVVPEGLEVTEVGQGGVAEGGIVRWDLGPIAAGESATVTLVGTVTEATPGTTLEVRVAGEAVAGETTVALAPVEACVDDAEVACASIVVAAAPASPGPSTPPSTPPSAAPSIPPGAGGAGGTLPETGADLAPVAWIVAMAMLLTGLGIVLRRRTA